MKVTSTEFQQNVGRYQDAALQAPVSITKNGRPHTVLMSAAFFEVVVKGRVARKVEDLDDDTLKAIAGSTVGPEYASLDHLLKRLDSVSVPKPQPGLVISYAYLWTGEHAKGLEEGLKDRPCAIVAARQVIEGREVVTVVPITHTPPADPLDAVEIPPALKAHLGLDDFASWIVVTETNDFIWPGPDLRARRGVTPTRFDYGMLPPGFFTHVRDRVLQMHLRRKLSSVPRTD